MGRGLRSVGIEEARELPLADGGEGTLDALLAALGGERRSEQVTGPSGGPVRAEWGVLPDGTAVIEMAQASGLALVRGANDPLAATTRGTGELIAAAIREGARRIFVGVGGSATVDGGIGALEALDWSLHAASMVVACDVRTTFVDAAAVFGPQKGAGPEEVERLTVRLAELAERYRRWSGVDVRRLPGAGAAGGLAGGLAAIGAVLRPGFEVVAEAVGFEGALAASDLVVTGEGRLDVTSLAGKVVGEVLSASEQAGIPCTVIAGQVAADIGAALPRGVELVSLVDRATSPEGAMRRAAALVEEAAAEIGQRAGREAGVESPQASPPVGGGSRG